MFASLVAVLREILAELKTIAENTTPTQTNEEEAQG